MSNTVLAIGPHSPPITGPGLKNRYLHEGLENQGFDVDWINTLNRSPQTVLEILTKTARYDAYILSASTKVRLLIGPLLATKLQAPDVHGALFPAGGEFANELSALPSYFQSFYIKTFSSFDGIYPQTTALTNDLQEIFGHQTQIRTVPNFRPLPDAPSVAKSSQTDTADPLRLVYVGRIKESKGLDNLLYAFEKAKSESTDVELDIYGHFLPNDPYKSHFLKLCSKIPGVRFHGKIANTEVIETLQKSDVFVFPTVYEGEGFPGAVVEAFAAGCPIIATDWNFNDEIITDKVNGRLYEPHDVAELATHIKWISENPKQLEEMQRNAYETSKEYSVEHVTSTIVTYLNEAGWDLTDPPANRAKSATSYHQ